MRTTVIALMLVALAAVACSDRVPAPTTPTPSPRPGYPPAPASELPEGVLYVQKEGTQPSPLFAFVPGEGARKSVSAPGAVADPTGSHALAVSLDGDAITSIGVLSGLEYVRLAEGRWPVGNLHYMWSNDGRRLAYAIAEGPDAGLVHVWTLDTGSGEETLVSDEPGPYSLIGWTGAGEVLARTPDGLMIFGKRQRVIPMPEPGEIADAVLSTDGMQVSVVVGEIEHGEGPGLAYIHTSGIWMRRLNDGDWRQVLDLTGEPPDVLLTVASARLWSPDGRRMTLHRTRVDESGVIADGLSVVEVRTGEETRVHDQGWGWESWSPDGRYLAYMHRGNAELGQSSARLGLLGPDGEPREVNANVRQMAWTKDGRLLVDIPARLSLLDPETLEVEEFRDREGKTISAFVESSVWSPSGRYVALSTPPDTLHRSSLYIMDTETGRAEPFLDEAGFWARAWLRE